MAGRAGRGGDGAAGGKGGHRPARGGPARGSRPPFQPGNTAALRSGAYSARVTGPLAEEILAGMLADEGLPERLRAPECWADLEKLALLRARAQLLWDELGSMDVDEMAKPRRVSSPFEIWAEADAQASRLQEKLGLDPIDVLLEQREADAEARLERMAELGAQIMARREAQG